MVAKKDEEKGTENASGDVLDQTIATVASKAEETLAYLRTYVIDSDAEFQDAAKFDAKCKADIAAIEAARKELTDPLNGVVKKINAKAAPAKAFLEGARDLLKMAMGKYAQAKEAAQNKALEAAAQLAKQGDSVQAGKALSLLDSLAPPKTEGISMRDVWVVVSVDPNAVPREFMMPDMKKIEAAVKNQISVPGVVVRRDKKVVNFG